MMMNTFYKTRRNGRRITEVVNSLIGNSSDVSDRGLFNYNLHK